MLDVHVQAHADGVGRHQKIDLALLEQFDLGVAGLGAERTHDHGRTAALTTDQFSNGIDLFGREGDDGRALRQAGQFLRAGIGEGGQALAQHDFGAGEEAVEQRCEGLCAEKNGLETTTRVQQTVSEDVAALGIAAKLDFIDGQEVDLALQRHGLDRADEIGRQARNDLFLAGNQGHGIDALDRHDAFVDFAGQQAQGQAHHAGGVAAHALDGIVGLAGIGRAEHGHQLRVADGVDHGAGIGGGYV